MNTNEELKELASQLGMPSGAKGLEVAQLMNKSNINMTLHAISKLSLYEGNKILELGHGNGEHLKYLLKLSELSTYHGLEISDLMHQEAQRINQHFIECKQAFFQLYDGLNLPFRNNYFDRIFTVNTIYFWQDPIYLINELYRITKPKGILNITFVQKKSMKQLPFVQFGFNLYSSQDILSLVQNATYIVKSIDSQQEQVMSKSGEWIEREYTTITLFKDKM